MNSKVTDGFGNRKVRNCIKGFIFYVLLFFIANIRYPPFVSFAELCVYFSILSSSFLFLILVFLFVLVSGVVMFYYVSKIIKRNKSRVFLSQINLGAVWAVWHFIFFVIYNPPIDYFIIYSFKMGSLRKT